MRFPARCIMLAQFLLVAACLAGAPASAPVQESQTIRMQEVSAFEAARDVPNATLARGQVVPCSSQPAADLKYPSLNSFVPLYGEAEFGRMYSDPNPGMRLAFVIDESSGAGKGYDRFWIDLDGDRDFSDEKPVAPLKSTPEWRRYTSEDLGETLFDYVTVEFSLPSGSGRMPFPLMPCLNCWKGGEKNVLFIATKARKGHFTLGKREYDVYLSQPFFITGRFDLPSTQMTLVPEGGRRLTYWWGGNQLNAVHVIDGQHHEFATTPQGDTFTIRPYKGQFGLLRVGAGPRKIDKVAMRGSVENPEHAVAVGEVDEGGWPEDTVEATLPVGDYAPSMLDFTLGRLQMNVSSNYHSDGIPRNRDRKVVYGIAIRRDRPFVMDFANQPSVLFACPARDQVLHPGEEIKIQAVLIDPKLDIMIRGLRDTSRKSRKVIENPGGGKLNLEEDASLDPRVTVTDANGRRVDEGVMPFG